MADNDHILSTESTPLNTTLEPNATDATTEATSASTDHSSNPASETVSTPEAVQHDTPAASAFGETAQHGAADPIPAILAASEEAEPEYDAEDFAKALESFDREQAAEKESAQSLTAEEVVVIGTVVKITDKHVVVDIGLKSEGLIPLDQVLDHTGTPKFKVGDSVEVVVEREENEGGYLVSYEKALRHKVWDKLEEAANNKTPVKGMVLSRVKGGLTVDIGIKAFLPGSQVEVRPVRNLDGYVGTEIEVRVIKLNKKRGNVVISRKELLEEDQNAKK
ncbi:MAG TPA: S1 RNA-binding domain-containing protein, partial [Acidobacteriaceae bacterium]|nr:S1 RNA-binding domain-containing protein [Acidobacteriaceae bacterium]